MLIVLLPDGISFAIQAFIFLVLGTFADFGHWRPYILTVSTIITIAVSFAWLGVEEAYKWKIGIGLYIVGLVGYQTSLTFWTAAFPGLARNLPEVRESRAKLEKTPPETTPEQHHLLDVITRNRVSNVGATGRADGGTYH
jgi:MFS-type transporter involved in bile tolerance (Atg22 family)